MDNLKVNLELLVNSKSVDVKNNAVSVTLSDSTPVSRYDWDGTKYNLILEHTTEAVDLARSDILPILWNHNDNGLPLGSYDNVKLENEKLNAVAKFDSEDDFAMKIFGKVKNGHIKTLSVGAEILEKKVIREEDDSITVIATKWQPYEGSFTSNPANPNARVSLSNQITEDKTMLSNQTQGEDMKLNDVLKFVASATDEDKIALKNALGDKTETLSAQVTDLEKQLVSAKEEKITFSSAVATASVKTIVATLNDEKFQNIPMEDRLKQLDEVTLSADGSLDENTQLKMENSLMKQTFAQGTPQGGEQVVPKETDIAEDPYAEFANNTEHKLGDKK